VGRDVANGEWAIYGARLGTYMTMLTDWDYTEVQDFTKLAELWDKHKDDNVESQLAPYQEILTKRLGLPIVDMSAEQSRFFKHHYMSQFKNKGIMCRE
jgi:hypothetical protein